MMYLMDIYIYNVTILVNLTHLNKKNYTYFSEERHFIIELF